MRERIIAKFAARLADFMGDTYGSVVRKGSTWTAWDGGASYVISNITEDEAQAIDDVARDLAYN
jgi:hypothetical protein